MNRLGDGRSTVKVLLPLVFFMCVSPIGPASRSLAEVAGSGSAGSHRVVDAVPDSSMAQILADLGGEPLALAEAIAVALEQATAARIAAAELAAARGAVRSEQGAFDPELFGEAQWSGADTPSTSPFLGVDVLETEQQDIAAGIRMSLPLGTELTASLNTARQTTNSAFDLLSPKHETAGALSLRQPLLKGFGPSANEDLAYARQNYEAAHERYAGALLAVRTAVEAVYWELYTAERDYAVARLIRDRAEAFLDEAKLRAQAGLVGPNQVANARVFLAEQEQVVLDREEQLDRISDRLVTLLGQRPQGGLLRYRPLDEPPGEFPAIDQDALVAVALRDNHDLLALTRGVEALRARERAARWNRLPTLDVYGSLGGTGLSGTPRPVVFPGSTDTLRTTISGGFGDSWTQVRNRDYPSWNVGFVFALPIGNRGDSGEHERRRAEVLRAEQQLEAARRSLDEQVRAQHRELTRGSRRLEIAAMGVDASNEQVRIGLLEYKNGRTTAFEVVRLAADLAAAQQRYSRALVRTARAAAELRRLTADWYPDHLEEE